LGSPRGEDIKCELTYNESTGNQDNDATLTGGLGIKGGNLVAHLLEGEGLKMITRGKYVTHAGIGTPTGIQAE